VALGVFPSLAKHPIQKLRDAGVLITVSTDDPPFFHTDMKQAFCDIETKQILLKALESA